MRALADNGRFVLAEDGARLVFLERRGLVPAWALFVVGLIAGITGLASVGIAAAVHEPGRWLAVAILLAIGGVFAMLLRWLMKRRRERLARPLAIAEAIAVIDAGAGVLADAAGRTLAPLTGVKFVRVMQATSSSRALAVTWSGGRRTVYRGDPFSGSIDGAVDVLRARGFTVS